MKGIRRQLNRFQIIVLLITGMMVFVPVAQANLVQALQLIVNWIMTAVEGTNAVLQSEEASGNAELNAEEMRTKIEAAAEGAVAVSKVKLDLRLNFGSFGEVAGLKINSVAPGGCFTKKRDEVFREYAKAQDEMNNEIIPKTIEYSMPAEEVDLEADENERREVFAEMKAKGYLSSGFFPSHNLNPEDYELWGKYIKHITVPQPFGANHFFKKGKGAEYVVDVLKFQQIVYPAQKAMLDASLRKLTLDGSLSRDDMLNMYRAYATSFKRTRASNAKTPGGVQREIIELQSMLMDVESEILKSNRTISSLMASSALIKAEKYVEEKR